MPIPQCDELVHGLFDLRSLEPIRVYRHPSDRYLHLVDTLLDQVFLYAFGREPYRRLLVRGPGTRLREFGVAPDHDAFWAAYVRDIGTMPLSRGTWPMPWIEWRPEDFARPTAAACTADGRMGMPSRSSA